MNHALLDISKEVENHPLPEINKPRTNDDDFVDDLIITSNLVLKFLAIAASSAAAEIKNKLQQGILLGHMVRIFKLYDCFLLLICNNRFEISILLARAIVETSIVLKYLINNINDDLCQKIIKSSLAYDKKLWEMVQKKSHGKELQAFEKRILLSIKKTFDKSDFKLEDINFSKDSKWHHDLSSLAKKVGLNDYYETMYRTGSRAEHGSWHFLEQYHLKENNEYYEPELRHISPTPQLLEAVNYISLNATMDYMAYIQPNEVFLNHIQRVINWHKEISQKHEDFLASNT